MHQATRELIDIMECTMVSHTLDSFVKKTSGNGTFIDLYHHSLKIIIKESQCIKKKMLSVFQNTESEE